MRQITSQALRVVALGEFSAGIPPLAPRLAALNVAPLRIASIEQLPAKLDDHDILLTTLNWLNSLSAEQRDELSRRATPTAGWIALTDDAARFKDQVTWQRLGVSHFFNKPLDPERLAGLVEDIHDRLAGPPIRAILLDDDESSLAFYGKVLQQAGIQVLATQDPLLVLESLDEHRPDVLVLDIEMPGCRGPELATIVRQRSAYARLPVIFLTAMESMQDKLLARAAAAEDFLAKPVAPELLLAAVESHALRYRAFLRGEQLKQQQQAQAKLRLEQLRQAIDEHAIVSIADAKGNIIHVNDKFCAISGYTRQELLGQNHRMVKSSHHDKAFYADLWHTITSGRIWQGEVCNRSKEGELYWVEATIFPILDRKGAPNQYISIRTDITALKASQEAMRVAEERLRRGQQFANIGTWEWTLETGELYWSERIAPLFGHAVGTLETSYDNFLAAIHPDDRQAVTDAVAACIERDVPYEIEHRVVWPDGTVRWLLERGAVTRDESGKALKMLGVVQDIDARMRAQKQAEQFRMMIEQTAEPMFLIDVEADYRLVYCNEAAARHWGAPMEELLTWRIPDWDPNFDEEKTRAHYYEMASQDGVHLETLHRVKDGRTVSVEIFINARTIESKPYIYGTFHNIEARLRTQQTLAENARLLREAQTIAHLGHWSWDVPSGQLHWSDEIYRIFGLEPGSVEPTYERFFSYVHPDDVAAVKASEQGAMHAGGRHSIDHRIVLESGQVRWVHEEARGEFDASGKLLRVSGTVQDVTEHRQTMEQVQQLGLRLQLANRTAGIGIWDWDVANNILVWDDMMYASRGCPAGERGDPTGLAGHRTLRHRV